MASPWWNGNDYCDKSPPMVSCLAKLGGFYGIHFVSYGQPKVSESVLRFDLVHVINPSIDLLVTEWPLVLGNAMTGCCARVWSINKPFGRWELIRKYWSEYGCSTPLKWPYLISIANHRVLLDTLLCEMAIQGWNFAQSNYRIITCVNEYVIPIVNAFIL